MPHYNDGEYDTTDELKKRRVLRDKLHTEREYIVDPLFPAGAVHLIAGPSGIGKTTWLLQQLHTWSKGEDVLGYSSHPCPWVYVSCDRALRETDATMRRLELGDWDAPVYCIEEVMGQGPTGILDDPSIFTIEEKFPDAKLIVIEGLQSLLPDTGRGRSSNKAEMLWMIQLRDGILSKGKTIIATTHSPKSSQDYVNERSNFLGTQSLIGACSTLVSFDIPRDVKESGDKQMIRDCLDREIAILPRDSVNHYLSYTRRDNGAFELSASKKVGRVVTGEIHVTTDDHRIKLDTLLSRWNPNDPLTSTLLKAWQKDYAINERTMYRWIGDMTQQGRLKREQRGVYTKARMT